MGKCGKKFHGKKMMDIHHRIPKTYYEKGILKGDPNRLSNLYALPKHIHQDIVNKEWIKFNKLFPYPTQAQIIKKAIELDKQIMEYINIVGR